MLRQTSTRLPEMGHQPIWLSTAEEKADISSDDTQKIKIAHERIGCRIDKDTVPAIIVDALCDDYPIVGASDGFVKLTGYPRDEIVGQNCRFLLNGVPEAAVSRSLRKNVKDYCRMCRLMGLYEIAEIDGLQPNCRQDGSYFMNSFVLGLCCVDGHPYILGIQVAIKEGFFGQILQSEVGKVAEQSRVHLRQLRERLKSHEPIPARMSTPGGPTDFKFFSERLQDHAVLLNNGITAVRREPEELVSNCLVFGDIPVKHTPLGLFFAVMVDHVVETFEGLPILGFTRRKPVDDADLYPFIAKCLGKSVLIGAGCEAYARDRHEHYRMGFRKPPESEIASWSVDDTNPNNWTPEDILVQLKAGDTLGCLYTHSGQLQLYHNSTKILDFHVQRPVAPDVNYYAVIDVCFTAYSLSILPSSQSNEILSRISSHYVVPSMPAGVTKQEDTQLNTDPADVDIVNKVRALVHDGLREAMQTAVLKCSYCVSIADPRAKDQPLIAVSSMFETMTGFTRQEIIGHNCRFLNRGTPISDSDIMGLRIASQTGAPFIAMIPNRKKNGDLFVNLLDLRGFTVGRETTTGERLWFLVGVQADVTEIYDTESAAGHFGDLQKTASLIRDQLQKDLARMCQMTDGGAKFEFYKDPIWMTGNEDGGLDALGVEMCLEFQRLQVTMPPESFKEVTESMDEQTQGAVLEARLKTFVEAYTEAEVAKGSKPRYLSARWWSRDDRALKIGIASIVIGISAVFVSRSLRSRGRL